MGYFTREQDKQWRALQPKKMIVAKVVVVSSEGKVLLVKPSYKPTWQLPGGGVDAGESPEAAAVREIHEETGVEYAETDLRLIGTIFRFEQDILFLMYELHVGDETLELTLQDDEIEAYEWVAPSEVGARLPDYYTEFLRTYFKAL